MQIAVFLMCGVRLMIAMRLLQRFDGGQCFFTVFGYDGSVVCSVFLLAMLQLQVHYLRNLCFRAENGDDDVILLTFLQIY